MSTRGRNRTRNRAATAAFGGPSYDADAQAYFTRASIVDETYMDNINTLIAGIKSDLTLTNFSDAFDCFWIYANVDGTAALYNAAKNDHHCTNINSTTFAAGEGFTGNRSTMRLSTDYVASTDAVALLRNSCSFGAYLRLNTEETKVQMGALAGSGDGFTLIARFASNLAAYRVSSITETAPANTDARGLFVGTRNNATHHSLYRNAVSLGEAAANSTALNAVEFDILANNTNGSHGFFSANQISVAFLGRGFSAGEITSINTRIEAYMDALGKGVQ